MTLSGITAGYEDTTVLRDVDLAIPDNAVVALLGPNGAGKTTLLRVASGLLKPWAGRIELDGRDVTGSAPHTLAAAGVCHVPEGRGVFPGLSVAENLRLHERRSTTAAERERVLAAFPRLRERLTQRAGSLSGGEQQMLALAHAYTGTHRAVLLDEVSMGLAPRIVDEIFDHLRVLAASGTSLLLVEQYVKRALELADYVYVLRRGQIEFAGEPWQLGTDAILSSYLGETA